MFAWIEAGRSNTFVSVGSKDVVFRTATLSNNIVIGNDSNAAGSAAIYVHENRVGVRRLPMVGANVDVAGNLAVSKAITVYDESDHRSNFGTIGSDCTKLTHSNVTLVADSGGHHVYAGATGLISANTLVAQQLRSVSGTFSNVVVMSAEADADARRLRIKLLEETGGGFATDAYTRRGAQVLIGKTPYDVVGATASADATTLTLETTTPDGALVQDARIVAGGTVDIQVVADAHAVPVAPRTWDPWAVVLAQCDFQSAQGGRVLKLYAENLGDAPFSRLRRMVGTYVALGKDASSMEKFTIVKVVNVSSQAIDGSDGAMEAVVDVCAPDASALFASSAVSRLQLTFGSTLVARKLRPLHAVEREYVLEQARLVAIAVETRAPQDNSGGGGVGEDEQVAVMTFAVPATDSVAGQLRQELCGVGGVNAVVRGAMIGGNLPRTVRYSVNASWAADGEGEGGAVVLITLETLAGELGSTLPEIAASYALRLRCFGERFVASGAELLDPRKAAIQVAFQGGEQRSAAMLDLLGEHAAAHSAFASLPTLFGAHACALRVLEVRAAAVAGATAAALVLRQVDHAALESPALAQMAASGGAATPIDARLALFAPFTETLLHGDAAHLAGGASVGRQLVAEGGILVRNDLQFADAYGSDLGMRITYTSNVMNFAYAPVVVPHEASPKPMLPFMTLSTSNLHLRSAMIVDGQVTAKHVRTTSDARLKTNIVDSLPKADLEALMRIPIRRFDFIEDVASGATPSRHVGVLAQEVAGVIPSAVGSTDGFVTVPRAAVTVGPECVTLGLRAGAGHDFAAGDILRWVSPASGAQGTSRVKELRAGILHIDEAIDNDAVRPGDDIDIVAKIDKLKVIDTTELLCLTMNALKELNHDLQRLRGQIAGAQKN